MLLGHNWVTNGSYLHKQTSYKSDIGGSDYTAQKLAQKWVFNDMNKKSVTFGNSSRETTQKTTHKTTHKVLYNTRVNNLHANCIQIAPKNKYLLMIVRGNRETEPQINADERRLIDLDYPPSPKYEQPQCSDSKSSALQHFEFLFNGKNYMSTCT